MGSDSCVFPQSLGHECAGQVVKASSGSKFHEGDRVAVEPAKPCMNCEQCLSGHYNCCPHVKFLGSPSMPGAFAERLAIDESQLHAIPDTMSYDEAAILEPLRRRFPYRETLRASAGSYGGDFRRRARSGSSRSRCTKRAAQGEIVVIDKLQYRLDFAVKEYGADHAVNVNDTDPIEYIKKHTSARGVDIACECAGVPETVRWSFEAARIRGRAMIVGIPEVDAISFNPHRCAARNC